MFFEMFLHKTLTFHWKKHFRVTKGNVLPNLVFGLELGHFFVERFA
jgi:hypothetical protein